jgi:hypothetical protein
VKDDDFHKLETIPEFMCIFPPFLPSTHHFCNKKVYYEEKKRDLNRILIYECRFDESQKPKPEESTRLTYTGLCHIPTCVGTGSLEHLKIETRLIDERLRA